MENIIGTKGRCENTVTEEMTAAAVGSGTLRVYATPCVAALIEKAAESSVRAFLEAGQASVGTQLDFSHERATPVGMKVWAETEVTAFDGRKITFTVAAFDERGRIASGTHERFIVAEERFLAKCYGA